MKLLLKGKTFNFDEEGVKEQSIPSNKEDVHPHQPFPEVVELSIDIIQELRIKELSVVLIEALPDLIHCNHCTQMVLPQASEPVLLQQLKSAQLQHKMISERHELL